MFLFKEYLLVGGMPKVVDAFIEDNKQFENSVEEKREILKTYRNDIMKINQNYKAKVLSIYDQIPGFLSSHEKRVRLIQSMNLIELLLMRKHSFGLRIQ